MHGLIIIHTVDSRNILAQPAVPTMATKVRIFQRIQAGLFTPEPQESCIIDRMVVLIHLTKIVVVGLETM